MDYYKRKMEATKLIVKLSENKVEEKTIKLNVLTTFGFDNLFVDKVLILLKG